MFPVKCFQMVCAQQGRCLVRKCQFHRGCRDRFPRRSSADNGPAENNEDLKADCFSALPLLAPVQSREDLIALWRIAFQETGMGCSAANEKGRELDA